MSLVKLSAKTRNGKPYVKDILIDLKKVAEPIFENIANDCIVSLVDTPEFFNNVNRGNNKVQYVVDETLVQIAALEETEMFIGTVLSRDGRPSLNSSMIFIVSKVNSLIAKDTLGSKFLYQEEGSLTPIEYIVSQTPTQIVTAITEFDGGNTFKSGTFVLNAAGNSIVGSDAGITLEKAADVTPLGTAIIRIPTTKTLKSVSLSVGLNGMSTASYTVTKGGGFDNLFTLSINGVSTSNTYIYNPNSTDVLNVSRLQAFLNANFPNFTASISVNTFTITASKNINGTQFSVTIILSGGAPPSTISGIYTEFINSFGGIFSTGISDGINQSSIDFNSYQRSPITCIRLISGADGWIGIITAITATYFEITLTKVGAGLAITSQFHTTQG